MAGSICPLRGVTAGAGETFLKAPDTTSKVTSSSSGYPASLSTKSSCDPVNATVAAKSVIYGPPPSSKSRSSLVKITLDRVHDFESTLDLKSSWAPEGT